MPTGTRGIPRIRGRVGVDVIHSRLERAVKVAYSWRSSGSLAVFHPFKMTSRTWTGWSAIGVTDPVRNKEPGLDLDDTADYQLQD
jgi:hypothetical protein